MKIDIISDIHLTCFKDFGEDFVRTWISEGDLLILAGDIGEFHWWQTKSRLIDVFCQRYEHVLYIAGNHDYYGTTLEEGDIRFRAIEDRIKNFHFLERDIFEFNNIKFAGCSLWFKEDPMSQFYERFMNDFTLIQQFKPAVYERNQDSQEFLRSLQNIDVIITHHLPSQFSVHERYTGDSCNRFFLCEMDDVILNLAPKFHIHGHTHMSCDYKLGDTRIICNPLGYPRENPGIYGPVTIEM